MRLPPIAPEALDTEQRRLYDDMKAGVASKYDAFVTVSEDGALLGPWSAWLYQPELGTAFWTVTKAMTAFKRAIFCGVCCEFVKQQRKAGNHGPRDIHVASGD
jgi:hypothetical protein